MAETIPMLRVGAKRDPERRRAEIIGAAAALITESGIGPLTHRLIAQRAGVPLGSTTYYFPTLEDLTLQALRQLSGTHAEKLEAWAERLIATPDAETVVALIEAYLSNGRIAAVEYEVYVAAARRPELRPLATEWESVLLNALEPALGKERARTAVYLFDGIVLSTIISGGPLDRETALAAIRPLFAD